MRKSTFLIALAPLFCCAQNMEDTKIKTTKINDRICFFEGRGGNIGVVAGDEGIMLVDDQFAPLSEKIKAAASVLSDGNVKFVLNTHYHGDHTGGNENFKEDGALIVGHENVRKRLGASFTNKLKGTTVKAKSETYWPVITFSSDMTLHFNEEEVQLVYVPAAHTDGDILVYFKTSNVLHCGDSFVRYGYPYIDISAGGTIDGFIAAQEKILEIADANTVIVPGHGKLSTEADVKESLAMLKKTRAIVLKAKQDGVDLEELIGKGPLKDYHKKWSGNFVNSDLFVQIIYESL